MITKIKKIYIADLLHLKTLSYSKPYEVDFKEWQKAKFIFKKNIFKKGKIYALGINNVDNSKIWYYYVVALDKKTLMIPPKNPLKLLKFTIKENNDPILYKNFFNVVYFPKIEIKI